MESRTTGPQIPHWSELPLQRDTKRWQPPPEENQVNIKLSDCLRLPAVRLAVTHSLRDALDHIPLGVILWTSLSSCNSVCSHSVQLSLCHSKLPPVMMWKMLGHVEDTEWSTTKHIFILRTGYSKLIKNWSLLMLMYMCVSVYVFVKRHDFLFPTVCVSVYIWPSGFSLCIG